MLENVQSRVNTLFRVENPTADDALIRVSQALIMNYPKLIYGYNNLGSLYGAKKQYAKALVYLKKALKINPNDMGVRRNIELIESRKKQ